MSRPEVLRAIQDNIETVIAELEVIRDRVTPVLKAAGHKMVDVGVDVANASVAMYHEPDGSHEAALGYTVVVYDRENKTSGSEVSAIIHKVLPEYQGGCLVTDGHMWYPASAVLNLQYLKDLHEASNITEEIQR